MAETLSEQTVDKFGQLKQVSPKSEAFSELLYI